MERQGELTAIGDILGAGGFWRPNTKEEEAAKFRGHTDIETGADGIVRCKRCGQPRMFYLSEAKRWLPCTCRCAGRESDEDFEARVQRLKRDSGIEGRNARADFDEFEVTEATNAALHSAVKYAGAWQQVKARGQGIYFYGAKDTGKTYIACCIANMLLAAAVQVVFATADTMLTEFAAAYQKRPNEADPFTRYKHAELLIVDALGSRAMDMKAYGSQGYAQDRLQQLIDERHTLEKPTIFTSQYTLQGLVERGFRSSTVDRIAEMTPRRFEMKGRPHRQAVQELSF